MFIERDGLKFELSRPEMYQAFYELQQRWDKEDIMEIVTCLNDSLCEEMRKKLTENPELLEDVAYMYRQYLNETIDGSVEWECLSAAYDYCLAGYGNAVS